jgi:hypothetical protein
VCACFELPVVSFQNSYNEINFLWKQKCSEVKEEMSIDASQAAMSLPVLMALLKRHCGEVTGYKNVTLPV